VALIPAGAELVASMFDDYEALTNAWTSYTPSWIGSSSNPTLGNGIRNGAYISTGKRFEVSIDITFGSTTTAGSGTYTFGLPAGIDMVSGTRLYGSALLRDNSAAVHSTCGAAYATSTTVELRVDGGNVVGSATPWVWANVDFIRIYLAGEQI
jgi:hypothetical protein